MASDKICKVDGCGKDVRSNGLCCAHYYRFYRHGTLDQTRPADWGKREKHPLYASWNNLRGYPSMEICEEWLNDFWQFVADVVERPNKKVFLKRPDETKPFGKDNFAWMPRLLQHDGTRAGMGAAKSERFKQLKVKKLYKLSAEDRAAMFEKQNHLCAICKRPEVRRFRAKGGTMSLAVDHCHTTGKIRGLLCGNCNQAIGLFREDVVAMQAAVDYLKAHLFSHLSVGD